MQISEMKSKIVKIGMLLLFVLGILYLMRRPILLGLSSFLIVEGEIGVIKYAFVLSGGAFDRGTKAADLFHQGKVEHFICTGVNQSPDLKALGFDTLESDLTKIHMMNLGVPDSIITLMRLGTSTLEESNAILNYCLNHSIDTVLIISSKFHTRRVYQVFTEKFAKQGRTVLIQGAPSSSYNEEKWWESEYGLIALNNEYLKQLYYFINH
jgi:uncharacterized SAM-binding protein YcdF (DUF218 family)